MSDSGQSTELVILTNFVPPTRLPAFQHISRRFRTKILVDTAMEGNRQWAVRTEGIEVRVVPGISIPILYRHPQGFREKSYLHFPFGLLGALFAEKPKYMISGELGFRTGIACLYKMLRPSVRLVVWTEGTLHTDGPRGMIRKWWRRLLVRIPDRFVAVSTGAKSLLSSYGVPNDRIRMTFFVSGFYPPVQPPAREPIQRRRLLHSGRLNELKGVKSFAEALASVVPSVQGPVELWFVGQGPDESYLRNMKLPPGLSFRFLGFVPYERMPEVYQQCGILAFPTLADVWGLVTNEAMNSGMPVLGSRYAQSVCDLVTNNETGWTFLPDDRPDMERAIREALSCDFSELERKGNLAWEAVKNMSPESFAEELIASVLPVNVEASK